MARRTEKRGFGSIRRLPSGSFQARYAGPSGDLVAAPVTFSSRIDAEAWLHSERRLLVEPEVWKAPKVRLEEARREEEARRLPTFETYAERWIHNRRNSRGEPLRPSTRDKYLSSLRVHVYPTFGDTPLDEITRASVREWHEGLTAGPAAKAHAYTTDSHDPQHGGRRGRAAEQEPGTAARGWRSARPEELAAGKPR